MSAALPPEASKGARHRWWDDEANGPSQPTKEANPPEAVKIVRTLIERDGNHRRRALLQWYRLYNNTQAKGLLAGNYFRPDVTGGGRNRLALNVVKSAVDTLHSRLTRNEPKPTFLTSGGKYSDWKKAKLLDKWTQGLFYETGFPLTAETVELDSLIFGTGINKVFENDEGKVGIDRCFTEEVIVDEIEAVYGAPRSIFQVRLVSRDVLRGMFKGNADATKLIGDAPTARIDAQATNYAEQADLLLVVEAWHLPSSKPADYTTDEAAKRKELRDAVRAAVESETDASAPRAKLNELEMAGHDGRHGIYLETGVLHFEAWRKRYFPFSKIHCTSPVRGFLNGTGIPEDLVGIQYEINKILIMMSECLYWCVPKLLIEANSKVVQAHLDDIAGGVIKYHQVKPELVAWNAIPAVLFEQLDRLIRQAYEIIGVSQLSAQAKKPAGLESGAALREFANFESDRFVRQQKDYERFFVDTAKLAIRQAREIAETNGGSYPVNAPRRRRMVERIDWREIDLDDDDFVMQVFPTSALPRTPEGRLAMVQDLMNLGYLAKEDGIRLLNFPDLESVSEVMEASADFTNFQIEQMLEHGKPQQPHPYQNLTYAITNAQAAYLGATTMGIAEPRLQLVRIYINTAMALVQKTMQPAPQPGAQPGIPSGPPGPPPYGVPGGAPAPGALPPGMVPPAEIGATA